MGQWPTLMLHERLHARFAPGAGAAVRYYLSFAQSNGNVPFEKGSKAGTESSGEWV